MYLNPARFLLRKEAPPLAFAAHSFFQIPPPQKIRMERSGKARGRDARYSARGGVQRVAMRSERTWRVQATTHAERARLGVLLEVGSDFLVQ